MANKERLPHGTGGKAMKKHEEIKKGLECCIDAACMNARIPRECDEGVMEKDVKSYIRQLEAQNAELVNKMEQLQRERDALKNDLYMIVNDHVTPCFCCKIFDASTTVCEHEGDGGCFTWRGVPAKEEEHEVDPD
jgi:CRISPR/Cas system CMR-associated protein Cmr1 (group 7 of RAMP superfamily)